MFWVIFLCICRGGLQKSTTKQHEESWIEVRGKELENERDGWFPEVPEDRYFRKMSTKLARRRRLASSESWEEDELYNDILDDYIEGKVSLLSDDKALPYDLDEAEEEGVAAYERYRRRPRRSYRSSRHSSRQRFELPPHRKYRRRHSNEDRHWKKFKKKTTKSSDSGIVQDGGKKKQNPKGPKAESKESPKDSAPSPVRRKKTSEKKDTKDKSKKDTEDESKKDVEDVTPAVPKDEKEEENKEGHIALKNGVTFRDDLKGWGIEKTQKCGNFSTILGGPKVLEKDAILEKTFHLPCQESYLDIFFRYAKIDAWNGEEAWLKINGRKKWTDSKDGKHASFQCGKKGVKDSIWNVTMKDVKVSGRIMNVKIGSDLKADPDVASFGMNSFTVKPKCIGGSTRRGKKFSLTLGSKNGVPRRKYEFAKVQTSEKRNHFSMFMRRGCEKYGMKPICDHKAYCRRDTRALYLGQSKHLAYPPHRFNSKLVPSGFGKIANRWDGVCSYTADQGIGMALCNIPSKTHKWRRMQAHEGGVYADSFMCGQLAAFTASLKAFGDTPERKYTFRVVTTDERDDNFNKVMIDACKEHGMKPVCDHPEYCKDDENAIYIGQKQHISYQAHRLKDDYFPSGWSTELRSAFDGLCVYSGNKNSGKALCNTPLKAHAWKKMGDYANSFMCAKIDKEIKMKDRAPHLPKMDTENLEKWTRVGENSDKITFQSKYHGKLPKGSGIESVSKITRPITIVADVMSPKADCLSFSIFNKDRKDDGGLLMEPGTGDKKDMIKFFPSKAEEKGKKLDEWRTIEIIALANGTTRFFLDQELYHKTDEGKALRSGFMYVKAKCDDMEIRNVKRSRSPLYIKASKENLYIKADGGSKKGVKQKLMECDKEDDLGNCQWWLEESTTKSDRYFIRISDSQLYLLANGEETGESVELRTCSKSEDSGECQWEVIPSLTKQGYHYIKVSNDELFLKSQGEGKDIVLDRCDFKKNSDGCQWKLEGWTGSVKADGKSFSAVLQKKNDAPTSQYEFKKLKTDEQRKAWTPFMIRECSLLGMRPVCDHPKYCKDDTRSLYIGQDKHLAFPEHRKDGSYVPKGFESISSKWNGVCSYTGKHGSGKALCNIPSKTHSWQRMGEDGASSWICGRIAPFSGTLSGSGDQPAYKYEFKIITTYRRDGKFRDVMVDVCKDHDMKPVCDNPESCKDDEKALYIGHKGHLSSSENCKDLSHFPIGWEKMRLFFKGLCFYGGNKGDGKAMCNIPNASNDWKELSDATSTFMCGKILQEKKVKPMTKGKAFEATLRSRGDGKEAAMKYEFRKLKVHEIGVNFSQLMVEKCKEVHMRPVCDHPKYCKSDAKSLYIGQKSHLAYPALRKGDKVPSGFSDIANKWDGVCSYTGKHGMGKALCNIPSKTHAWKKPGQDGANSFICGKMVGSKIVKEIKPKKFSAKLQKFEGTPQRKYEFRITTTSKYGGDFSALMVSECDKYDMMPVCDHPDYCKDDKKSVFIGQKKHIAYLPQRDNPDYFPKGWAKIKHNWSGLCSYTASHGSGKALCNIPLKTHTWRRSSEEANAFMCAKILEGEKKACDEQLRDINDQGYRGCQDHTISGLQCQKWTDQSPHVHKSATPETSPGRGLGDHNYCRNADDSNTIWCFTTDPKKRKEECAPKEKLGKYTGLQGDCKDSKEISTFPQCSVMCCKQQCDRNLKCKGFSHNAETNHCIIRSDKCERQPGTCNAKEKHNAGFCFFEKGSVEMKKFKYYELRADCEGDIIKTKKDIERQDCEKECTTLDECVGFSYHKEKMYCDLKKKACDHRRGSCLGDKCFWIKGKPKKLKETVESNLAPGCKEMEFGVKYTGEDLKQIDRVSSQIKCNAHCVANAKCNAWVWNMKTNICFLLKNRKEKQKNPDYVSGLLDRGVKNGKKVKSSKGAMVDGYARLKRSQRLERVQVIRRIKRQQLLARKRVMQKMQATQALRRLSQMRKLRKVQQKIRNLYLCRMRGECPMPGEKRSVKAKFSDSRTPSSDLKKMYKDLRKKKDRLKKDEKKYSKMMKEDAPKGRVDIDSLDEDDDDSDSGDSSSDDDDSMKDSKKDISDSSDVSSGQPGLSRNAGLDISLTSSGAGKGRIQGRDMTGSARMRSENDLEKKVNHILARGYAPPSRSDFQDLESISRLTRKEARMRKKLKSAQGEESQGANDADSALDLYSNIWKDDDSDPEESTGTKLTGEKIIKESDLEIGFDDQYRRKV